MIQGSAITYDTPGGLTDGTTYYVPMQVDASSLPTGVYPYTMLITENFGSGLGRPRPHDGKGEVNVINAASDAAGRVGASAACGRSLK